MRDNHRKSLLLPALLSFALTASAIAVNLPAGSRIQVETDTGSLIGSGHVERGELELDLLRGSTGNATLKVTTRDGGSFLISVFINPDGTITVMDNSGLQDFREMLRQNDLRLDLDFDDDLDDIRDDLDDWDDDWDDDDDDWDDDWDDDDWDDRDDDRRDREDDRRDRDDDDDDRDDDRDDGDDDGGDGEDDRGDGDDDDDDDDDDWDDDDDRDDD